LLLNSNNWPERSQAGRVLVIDGESSFRTVIRLMLKKGGYEVLEAENGAQAIEILRASKTPTGVDIIMCNIRLPHMNSGEPVTTLRQEFSSIPVVVLTGFPEVVVATSFFEQGIVDYRPKPIERDKLLAVVAYAMEQRTALKRITAIATTG
jgi:two-component system, chemotaxis family, chemotaxis protein CheY